MHMIPHCKYYLCKQGTMRLYTQEVNKLVRVSVTRENIINTAGKLRKFLNYTVANNLCTAKLNLSRLIRAGNFPAALMLRVS